MILFAPPEAVRHPFMKRDSGIREGDPSLRVEMTFCVCFTNKDTSILLRDPSLRVGMTGVLV